MESRNYDFAFVLSRISSAEYEYSHVGKGAMAIGSTDRIFSRVGPAFQANSCRLLHLVRPTEYHHYSPQPPDNSNSFDLNALVLPPQSVHHFAS
ncbi:hypothetical protein MRB53_024680 [Persea americana]|uniref:Uncharacterized protein n=1 Tax=Persea americana TaxID=3435 RepID=A0ACC2LDB0_PERAE|nr:hypothetical protein MRB53_024680 [Persea americana]